MYVKSCCFCIDLRSGSLLVGWIEMTIAVIRILQLAYSHNVLKYAKTYGLMDSDGLSKEEAAKEIQSKFFSLDVLKKINIIFLISFYFRTNDAYLPANLHCFGYHYFGYISTDWSPQMSNELY